MECCQRRTCAFEEPARVPAATTHRAAEALRDWDPDARDHEVELRVVGVTPAFFSRAATMAQACDAWDTRGDETITDVTHSGGIRTRRSSRTGVQHVRKTRCAHADVAVHVGAQEGRDFPTQVRLALAVEEPVHLGTDATVVQLTRVRRQHRRSFWIRGIRMDLSTVHMGDTYAAMEASDPVHEIEFELEEARGRSCVAHVVTSLLTKVLGFALDHDTCFRDDA